MNSTLGKKALLVGINKYHDSKLSDLRFAVNDVSSIYTVLTDPERGGFAPDTCLLMTDKSEGSLEPTRSNLLSSIKSLSGTAKPSDYVLLFFSGHGIEEEGKSYLLPSDARINVLRDTAVSIDWIKKTLQTSKARAKVLILDACHAGAMKGKAESGRMTKGLQDALFPTMEGFAILSSCKLHEVSYEMPEKKHGVFSYYVVEGLEGAADFDSDRHIMVSDVSRYATEKTMDWCFKEHVQQTPNLESHVVGDLILVDVPSPEQRKARATIQEAKPTSSTQSPITLIRASYSPKEEISGDLCTFLANHFELHEIKHKGDRYYFPLGSFAEGMIDFDYSPNNLGLITEIFKILLKRTEIRIIIYFSKQLLDIRKVNRLYRELKLKAVRFNPKLEVFLDASWFYQNSKEPITMSFFNDTEGKSGILLDFNQRKLTFGLFDEIGAPGKFLGMIGDIWAEKTEKKPEKKRKQH